MASSKRAEPVRPFLKWAGNKFRIIDKVRNKLPRDASHQRLVEPFVGSGALFLNSDYDAYLLSDNNPDLINLYTILRDDGLDFIDSLRPYFDGSHNNEAKYYEHREAFNMDGPANPYLRAALFIYLNRHGFNGLCRYNAKGRFNVPFGRYKRPYFPRDEMLAFHRQAQRAEFVTQCFSETMSASRAGDVIYCDPPYVPLSSSANFTSYSAGGFSMEQQRQLAELARANADNGVPVLVSNHSTDESRRLYRDAGADSFSYFSVQRTISCKGQKRGKAGELLALFA